MTTTPQIRSLEEAIFADRLAVVAMALFAVYLISVLAFILPPKLLDPLWQLSSIKIAVEAAPIPLLGLALLHLAAYLYPANLRLQRRRDALARLAILASLGFLLIVPLQGHVVWTSYLRSNSVASQQQASATERGNAVRQAITQATSTEDLQKRLLALQRPDLRITLDPERFPAIPLPQLKRQLLSRVDQAEGQFKARVAPIDPATGERITRESLRVMISSMAFAIAFATLAQRKNSIVPFLVEVPDLLGRLWASLRPRRAGTGQARPGMPFQKSASKREEEFFESLAPPEKEEPPAH
ncbi:MULTISPECIES: HpsJ family protein [unclassified Cyanobium]|uniref:HpsJ family protein n=1 Tax=unclassified Cyanobium TaxID=2627006 RepID=UPI0020CBB01C|nr:MULTISPECIES: HpsJ family protein [unclassified Cyanobium]MCP9858750.1 HpsJ family protein [Cyanobium sp. Cruz-8H5]MCP9865867.1 HpsJ family protein [Cyanobium sp. Cruz-8D1]